MSVRDVRYLLPQPESLYLLPRDWYDGLPIIERRERSVFMDRYTYVAHGKIALYAYAPEREMRTLFVYDQLIDVNDDEETK